MLALIDGDPSESALSVFDGAVLRGDGCFEAIRSYEGTPFVFDRHYQRLVRSAEALRIGVPPRPLLEQWVKECAADGHDCIVRVVLTRGASVPGVKEPPRCVVLWHPLPVGGEAMDLLPVAAPWHPGGEDWELSGVKTISYAANQAATRKAVEAGAEDAVLVSRAGHLLEGPTFSIAWVVDGVVETPSLDLGILESITRSLVLEDCQRLGIEAREVRQPLRRLGDASEFLALSTVKEVTVVRKVGAFDFQETEVTRLLQDAYLARVQLTSAEQASTGR